MSKKKRIGGAAMALSITLLASGCGGGGDTASARHDAQALPADESGPGDPPPVTPGLSADQQAFEALVLAPGGSHRLSWNLPYAGAPVSGVHHAASESASLTASPQAGPQAATAQPRMNLAATLPLPGPTFSRFLKDGAVLVVSDPSQIQVTRYVGEDILVDTLALDGMTVAHTQRRSGYSTVALTGRVGDAPADLAHAYNSFWSNPLILDASQPFQAGAQYVRFTATSVGDRHAVFDCTTPTTGADVSPCASGRSLADLLAAGFRSNSDGRTYTTADGRFTTVGGVSIWVAHEPRPRSATMSVTPQYRLYFERGGNVYTGALIPDGAVLSGNYWVSNPAGQTVQDRLTFLPFQVRLNQAARDSLAAAMRF